jgi:hypothetical protein
MNRAGRSSVAVLAAAGLTLGCLYWIDQGGAREAGALRREIADLRERSAAERKPEHVPTSTVPSPAVSTIAAPAAPITAIEPPPPLPIYRNEGRATARATLQTLAWACDQGDATTVQAMLVFDDAARAKAEQFFKSLSPEARGTWRTVEDMAALLITRSGMEAPFPAADVLDSVELEELSPDRVRMHLRGTRRDGSEFQRTSAGWSYVITETMVDRYTQQRAAGR